MRDFPHETEEFDGTDEKALDTSSPPRIGARHSVDAPYRDRHDALVERRRVLAREHDEAARAAARRERLAHQLAVIDESLAQDVEPLLASLPVARACRAKWDDMPGGDACRRCARCGHDVHDLARLTRHEADALVARLDAPGGLWRRPDGRVVAADCPPEPPSLLARIGTAGVAGAIAGGVMALAFGAPLEALERVEEIRAARAAAARVPRPPPVVRVGALQSDTPGDVVRPEGAAVRLLGPSTYEVDRARFASLGPGPYGGLRVIPVERDGASIGLQVYGVGRDGDLHALGIRNGDLILDVNGLPIAYPDQALDAYGRLRDQDLLVVRLLRRGEERVHVYHVRDAS